MNREPDPDGSEFPDDQLPADQLPAEHVPDEFDAIVAGWLRDGDVPRWPDGPEPDGPEPGPAVTTSTDDSDLDLEMERLAAPLFDATPPPPAPAPPRAARMEDDEEHFVPPEPPPLPRIGPPALVGLTLIILGLILTVSPGWIGVPTPYGLPLGLMSIASGLGWLVLRLWPDHSDDGPRYAEPDDDDDGAIL